MVSCVTGAISSKVDLIATDSAVACVSGVSAKSISSVKKVRVLTKWFWRSSGFIVFSFLVFIVLGGAGGARRENENKLMNSE